MFGRSRGDRVMRRISGRIVFLILIEGMLRFLEETSLKK